MRNYEYSQDIEQANIRLYARYHAYFARGRMVYSRDSSRQRSHSAYAARRYRFDVRTVCGRRVLSCAFVEFVENTYIFRHRARIRRCACGAFRKLYRFRKTFVSAYNSAARYAHDERNLFVPFMVREEHKSRYSRVIGHFSSFILVGIDGNKVVRQAPYRDVRAL